MKTPRDILLEKHAKAEGRLHEMRRDLAAELGRIAAESKLEEEPWASFATSFLMGWRQLLWSLRGQLAGLGAAWLLILILGLSPGEEGPTLANGSRPRHGVQSAGVLTSTSPQQLLLAAREHRRQLAELLAPSEERKTPETRPEPGRPRSQYQPSTQAVI